VLFDTVVTETDREQMRPVLARRVQYLTNRARQLPERRVESDKWHTGIIQASLHLEAAEGLAALGYFEQARLALELAVPHFIELQMPFGAALQRVFQLGHGSLSADADSLMRVWTTVLLHQKEDEEPESGGASFVLRAVDTPQQWAYYGLAAVMAPKPEATLDALGNALSQWPAVPVGRMRFPMDEYRYVITFCLDPARLSHKGRDSDDVVDAVAKILGTQIVALYRALQWASVNRYLWSRLLAPAPWFDFDVALLLGAVLTMQARLTTRISSAVVETVPKDARDYATEYVSTVRALLAISRPFEMQ
jgi:hypothetical protein